MRIFKFGGASVKDASGVRNVLQVLKTVGHADTLVVVSAMGKTTNALETVIDRYFHQPDQLQESIQEVAKYHNQIALDLFEDEQHPVFKDIRLLLAEMKTFLERNKSPKHPFVYDQIIGCAGLYQNRQQLPRCQCRLAPYPAKHPGQGTKGKIIHHSGLFRIRRQLLYHQLGQGRFGLHRCHFCLLPQRRERHHLEGRTGCAQCRPAIF